MEREENLTRPPHPNPLPRGGEGEGGRKDFNNTPHPCPLPQSGEGEREVKEFKDSIFILTCFQKVERGRRRRVLFYYCDWEVGYSFGLCDCWGLSPLR
jgi:hypothetical protein